MKHNRFLPVFVLLAAAVAVFLTAHVMKPGPGAQAKQAFESVEHLPVVTLAKNGELLLNGSPVHLQLLGEELQRRFPPGQSRVRGCRQPAALGPGCAGHPRARRAGP